VIENKKVLAVIQARGGSKGIPRKNIFNLFGHPLIAYTIAAAKDSIYIDNLIVSTDSDEIASVSELYGADVPFRRPPELAGDTVASVDSLRHAVITAESIYRQQFDIIVELPCVAPLRVGSDIDGALRKLVDSSATSVISMANTGEKHPVRLKRLVDDLITDFCTEYPEPPKGSRRQDLEPCYIRNGAIYSMTRETLIDKNSRHGEISRPYVMPDIRSINIDGEMDLVVAGLLIQAGYCSNKPKIASKPSRVIRCVGFDGDILITAPLHFLPNLHDHAKSMRNVRLVPSSQSQIIRRELCDVVGWMCAPCPTYSIDSELIDAAPKLRVIATPSTGTNHIDVDYCSKKGIKVVSLRNSPIVNSIYASSEYTFLLMASALRKLNQAFVCVSNGGWRDVEDSLRGNELNGMSLGVVGYGRIGRNLSRYANAFGMQVTAYDPSVRMFDPWVFRNMKLDELLATCDVVAVCVHLDQSTYRMVNTGWFSKMKRGALFVNTSRGDVVDEDALIGALESGHLSGAAVDVVSGEQELHLQGNKLIEYSRTNFNLVVTPHIAGLTYQSEEKAGFYALSSIIEYLSDKDV